MAAIDIVGLDHVVLRVRDIKRSIRFYSEVLGCQEVRRVEPLGLYQLRAGSSLVDLVDLAGPIGRAGGAGPGEAGRNLDHFCLRIARFEAAELRAHLETHGVEPGDVSRRLGAEGTGASLPRRTAILPKS